MIQSTKKRFSSQIHASLLLLSLSPKESGSGLHSVEKLLCSLGVYLSLERTVKIRL